MKAVIKREMKNYLKNPIYWIGILLVFIGVYRMVSPYLELHYFQSEEEILEISQKITIESGDADVLHGYAPTTEEERIKLGLEDIKETFIKEFQMSKEEADQVISYMQNNYSTIPEMADYLEREYCFYGAESSFDKFEYYVGDLEKVNHYIESSLERQPYSYYIACKFADFCGLFMGFFATILLAFLFISDTKKDMYELLHTKPISSKSYVLGKVGGGMAMMLLVLGGLGVCFTILCQVAGNRAGFLVNFWHIAEASILYIVPNLLMIVSIYTVVALLFHNPLPAVPLLLLYLVYSNMGSRGADGKYGYYGRPLAIMVRFPGNFFEIAPPPMVIANQIFLMLGSIVLICFSIFLWNRRVRN